MSKVNEECGETVLNALVREKTGCGKCSKDFRRSEKGMQCEICESWWHIKCIGMSDETYKYLKKEECKDLHWFCTGCSNDAINNLKMLMNLHSKQEKMTTEMVTLKFSVQELKINVNNINIKVNKQDREMEGMLKKMKEVGSKLETALDAMGKVTQIAGTETTTIEVTKLVEQKITEIRNEQEDKRQRENKMIFFGIKEDGNLEAKQRAAEDRVMLIELFEIMKTKEEILSITRLGRKKEGSCRPVLVEVQNEKMKWNIIGRAKLLQESKKGEDIYISPDQTVQERKDALELRNELKNKREESKKTRMVEVGSSRKGGLWRNSSTYQSKENFK